MLPKSMLTAAAKVAAAREDVGPRTGCTVSSTQRMLRAPYEYVRLRYVSSCAPPRVATRRVCVEMSRRRFAGQVVGCGRRLRLVVFFHTCGCLAFSLMVFSGLLFGP